MRVSARAHTSLSPQCRSRRRPRPAELARAHRQHCGAGAAIRVHGYSGPPVLPRVHGVAVVNFVAPNQTFEVLVTLATLFIRVNFEALVDAFEQLVRNAFQLAGTFLLRVGTLMRLWVSPADPFLSHVPPNSLSQQYPVTLWTVHCHSPKPSPTGHVVLFAARHVLSIP